MSSSNIIYSKYIKRLVDILAGLTGVVLFGIPMVFVMVAIKLTSPGPVIFKQKRLGRHGENFTIYKFRTMARDAEQSLAVLLATNAGYNIEYTQNRKLDNDPRVTKIGKFLRKTSIDELPQFFNILIGDMSLVGPRPYLMSELSDIENYKDCIFSCKPGLTGLWQISGRNKLSFDKRIELDVEYSEKISSVNDFKIIFTTIGKVLKRVGAK